MSRSAVNRWAVGCSLLMVFLAGCATSVSSKAKEPTLQTQVASLESRMAAFNQKLEELSQRQAKLEEEGKKAGNWSAAPAVEPRPKSANALTNREIQLALKAAGHYDGPIDGKIGPQTKEAVKAFQRSQGLVADGKVGARTSLALSKYLDSKE